MYSFEEDRASRLIALAGERFDSSLLPAELKVISASVGNDPPIQEVSQDRLPVRSEFLRWLATDKDAAGLIDANGIRVTSATIKGQLDFNFCRISPMLVFRFCTFHEELLLLHSELRGLGIYASRASKGILAHGAVLHGPLFLREGFESSGSVDFHSALIEASVQCDGKMFTTQGHSLSLEAATIRGDVFLTNEFQSRGEVRLLGVTIGGDFNCDGSTLEAIGDGRALSLDRARIRGNVVLSNVNSSATLSLPGVQIGGELNCRGAVLTAHNAALALDGASINGWVNLEGLKSSGELRFLGVHILGGVNCSSIVITASGRSLSFDRAVIQGSVFLCGIKSSGDIRMSNAQIEHNLDCRGASLRVLYCQNLKIGGDLVWTSIRNAREAKLNLAAASIHKLRDDKESWPSPGNLTIDGLVYEELSLHPVSSQEQLATSNSPNPLPMIGDERITWLRLQALDDYIEPQPWMHLSRILEAKGDNRSAKHVIFSLREEQSKQYSRVRRLWNKLAALLEEKPSRVLWSLTILIILGTIVFGCAYRCGAIAPTDKEAYTAWATGKSFQSAYPLFNPMVYTIENALPLVRLGQDDKWAPNRSGSLMRCWFLSGFRWSLICLGWFQATLLATAVGSRFKT